MWQTKQIETKIYILIFWATWSKFHKTDNPEDTKIALLEVSSLWNSEQIAATTRELSQLLFTKISAAIS